MLSFILFGENFDFQRSLSVLRGGAGHHWSTCLLFSIVSVEANFKFTLSPKDDKNGLYSM